MGILRALAVNILAVLRALSRIRRKGKLEKPSWQAVIEHAYSALCDPILDTLEFDACGA